MPRYAPLKTWVPVQSSNLEAVWYDAEGGMLKVKFLAKGKQPSRTYGYSGVPMQVYLDLLDAPSKGKYHAKHIKFNYPYMPL